MKTALSVAALAVLTACGPLAAVLGPRGGAPQQVEVSLDALTAPTLQVTVPSLGQSGEMRLIGVNDDVQTWAVDDLVSLSLRQGVLVSTRGFGHDLMGADAQPTLDALQGFAPDVYRRKSRYLTGDNHSVWVTAGCSMADVGMVDGLRQFEETCEARNDRFTNQFGLDRSGRIARARQWVSPQLGYVETDLRTQ